MLSNSTEPKDLDLDTFIRNIVDYPKEGIVFKDITPLLADGEALRLAINKMAAPYKDTPVDIVLGAESRGFIFGTALARELNCGFAPIRKKGRLPYTVISEDYELEYGKATLELHTDAISPGQSVLLCDDVLATGGTMEACCKMVTHLKGNLVGMSFLIELGFLNGRDKLDSNTPIHAILQY